jgi:PAS domain S-box-containing protein
VIRGSLRVKIALVLIVMSFVPVGALAVISVGEARARSFDSETALLAATADQLGAEIDLFHRGYQRASSRLAQAPEVIELLGGATLDAASLTSAMAARLEAHADGDPAVRGIGLIDRGGRVRAATEAPLVGADRAFRRYIQDGLQGNAVISDPYLSARGEPTIAYASPVFGRDRAVLGLAVFWVRAEAMWGIARRSNERAGADSFAVVFDHDGIRIAHTYSRDIVFHPGGALSSEVARRLLAERRFGDATKALLDDVRPFPAQFDRARSEHLDPGLFHGFAPVNGQSNYGVARRLTTVPWTVFYMVPEATVTGPITSLTRRWLIASTAIAVAALIVGVLLAAKLVGPLRALASATAAVAAGDLAARVDPGRRDELGTLGHAFNSMAERLERQAKEMRRAHEELEGLVHQRTAALAASNHGLRAEVAERVRADAAVREREQSLATTLDSIGDAVIVTDNAGVVVRMNPVAQALTGWVMPEAVGRPLLEVFRIVNEDTRDIVESPVERALREGRIVGLANHTVLQARDGAERPIADSAAPIIDKDATIRGVVLVFRDMTLERDAQRAVIASEHKYRDLYESSPDMHVTTELPGMTITDCNQTLCDSLGYDRSEVLGQPVQMLYHADSLVDVEARAARFHQLGELIDTERTLRRKDGRSIDVSLNLRGVRDPAGRLVAARGVWRDITSRKQIERDRLFLIQLGETLRISTEPTEVLALISTHLGGYLGVPRCLFADIDAATDQITIHRDHHAGLPSLAGTVPLSSFGRETSAESARGATVVLEDTAVDPRTAAGFAVGYQPAAIRAAISVPLMRNASWIACLAVCSDVPRAWAEREIALVKLVAERVWLWIEHLRALARLRETEVAMAVQDTEERFRTLVEGVRDYAIFMLDPDGNVATWNAGAERLKGYTSAEIIGKHASVFSTAEDRHDAHAQAMLEQAKRSGRFEEEAWRVRKDGSRFWANVVITSVRGRDGTLNGFAKVTRDFTQRRLQDEALRTKQAALTQSLKEREVLLQEVHHRVKNNLQVISSLINMQVRRIEPGSTRDALEECQTRVLAIALIHEKLYQSKDYSEVEFSAYTRSLAANVFHTTGISQREVSLKLEIDDIPLGVDLAIPCGLVINELITNSLKHGFKDGRTGTVRVALKKLDDGKLRLTVQDDGVGLPAGFRIDKAESMGLQLVCTLAEQLDATLVVANDRGASFQLTFAGSG